MKSLLALLLVSACFQAQSADLPPCDKAVRFSAAWFADPEVDNAKPAAELTKIGAGAGRSGTQLGHVVVETKLAVMPQTSCQGVVVRLPSTSTQTDHLRRSEPQFDPPVENPGWLRGPAVTSKSLTARTESRYCLAYL